MPRTNFAFGNLAGGGYAYKLDFASDGSKMFLRNDTGQIWQWRRSDNKWRDVSTNQTMPGITSSNTPYDVVFAPSDPTRAYCVINAGVAAEGTGGRGILRASIFRSNNGGDTWTNVYDRQIAGWDTINKYGGTKIAVDPFNSDVVYINSLPGVVYVTYNGGASWSIISDLLAALPNAQTNAPSAGGDAFLFFNSSPISNTNYVAFCLEHPLSVGTNAGNDLVRAVTSNTVKIDRLQNANGGGGTSAGVSIGDHIYFGIGAFVCVDPSATTKPNPGGSGVISNIVYVGWQSSPPATVWTTTNGGTTWGATVGGPTQIGRHAKITSDGILCVATGDTFFRRYVGPNPTGPQLAAGLVANTWSSVEPNPNEPILSPVVNGQPSGTVWGYGYRAGTYKSTNWGTSFTQTPPNGTPYVFTSGPPGISPNGTDNPWLNTVQDVNMGDAWFDPVDTWKLWQGSGVGIIYCHPSSNATRTISAISNAAQAVVTLSAGDWVIGDAFIPTGVNGMTQINNQLCFVQAVAGNNVTININTLAYSNYVSGGTANFRVNQINQNDAQQSMTTTQIVKAPQPNYRTLIAVLDRGFFSLANETSMATENAPGGAGIDHGSDVTYSITDPTRVWGATNNGIYTSGTSGVGVWPKVAINVYVYVRGGITGIGIGAGGSGYTPLVGTTTYTNRPIVPISGGTGATADYTVTNGSITNVVVVNQGDMYEANYVFVNSSDVGGTGSGYFGFCGTNSFHSQNGSPIVTVTHQSHGLTTANKLYFYNANLGLADFNNLTLANKAFFLTSVVDADHYTITSSTVANATGWGLANAWADLNGWPGGGGYFELASHTPTTCFAVTTIGQNMNMQFGSMPPNSPTGLVWTDALFAGSPKIGHGGHPFGNQMTRVCDCDGFGNMYYIDAQSSPWQFWKSADNGANWTFVSNPPTMGVLGIMARLKCTPGVLDEIWWVCGSDPSAGILFFSQAYKSTNGGVNWVAQSDFRIAHTMTFGAPKPGNTYPTLFMTGTRDAGYNFTLWRCDNASIPAASREWVEVSEFREVDCDGWFGGISGDPLIYGKIYIGTASTNYLYGVLDVAPPTPTGPGPGQRSMNVEQGVYWTAPIKVPQA